MVDDNFAKKIETDALTKAISKLGFNADIFMGKFDDVRYVEEMKKEFTPKETIDNTRFEKALEKIKQGDYTVEKLKASFELTELQQKSLLLL